MILYHGSDIVIEKPLSDVGRRELDFGPGFYVTKLFVQAECWSRRDEFILNDILAEIGAS